MKEKNKDLETRLALAKIEFEEMEVFKENQMVDIARRDDEIENLLKKEKMLNGKIDKLSKEKDDMEILVDKHSKEKRKLSDEMETQIMMLENVVESRDLKIHSLEEELKNVNDEVSTSLTPLCEQCAKLIKSDSVSQKHDGSDHEEEENSIPTTSKCGKCEYESDDECEMKKHLKSIHDFKCGECDYNSSLT